MNGLGDAAGAIAAGPSTLTFVQSSGLRADSSNVFTMLSSVLPGDICIGYGRYIAGSVAVPTGFTSLITFWSSPVGPIWCAYRIIQAGDASASFNNAGGGTFYVTNLAAFRPDQPLASLVIPAFTQSGPSSGAPSDIVVTPTGTPSVVIGCYHSDTAPITRGMSPAKDGEIHATGADNVYLAWKIYNSAPGATTISMTDAGGANNLFGGYIGVL